MKQVLKPFTSLPKWMKARGQGELVLLRQLRRSYCTKDSLSTKVWWERISILRKDVRLATKATKRCSREKMPTKAWFPDHPMISIHAHPATRVSPKLIKRRSTTQQQGCVMAYLPGFRNQKRRHSTRKSSTSHVEAVIHPAATVMLRVPLSAVLILA
jgi:hypothetical protein